MEDLIEWGAPLEIGNKGLRTERARHVASACDAHPAFEILELRQCERPYLGHCDIIVVRCTNHEVPNRNTNGIRVRETLALMFCLDDKHTPEVRALRKDFPVVPHLNGVVHGEPKSLCMAIDSWSAARRTWTAQRFLATILWWLRETACGTLHLPGQALERIYFDYGGELVLPPDYRGTAPANTRFALTDTERPLWPTFIVKHSRDADARQREHVPLYLSVERPHGVVDWLPCTLGALVDQWEACGIPLAQQLCERLATICGNGQIDIPGQHVIIILDIGVTRHVGSAVERRDGMAFLLKQSAVSLASAMGAVYRHQLIHYRVISPNPISEQNATNWRPFLLFPLEVKFGLTRMRARELAGIRDPHAEKKRVLLGVGALGSALADIWVRESWGSWTFVDPDHVQPHNLVRHRAIYQDIGNYKALVAKRHAEATYAPQYITTEAITLDATADDSSLQAVLGSAVLVVDASTTLNVPRELCQRDGSQRMTSAFLTPNGYASVLLMEDQSRSIWLDSIEAQYYRQILRSAWGARHLAGHLGGLAVGAGCRAVSLVLSPEMIELHAAILARRIRELSASEDAALVVWVAAEDGSVAAHTTPVRQSHRFVSESWHVVIDDEVIEQMRTLRSQRLPKETGGIIVGYPDHVSKTIYVVDVLAAPSDSAEGVDSFVRGSQGLPAAWREIQDKTALLVNYIGEWHSHPPHHGAEPSFDDLRLVAVLGHVLSRDGDPALMIIMASGEHKIYVCDSDGSTAQIHAATSREDTDAFRRQ